MAFRYREKVVTDGEAIDPSDWTENMTALAGEFNGHLDRDNFPIEVFEEKHIGLREFNQIFVTARERNNSQQLSGSTTDFQTASESISFEANADGVVIVHWSGWHGWDYGDGERMEGNFVVTGSTLRAPSSHNNRQASTGLSPATQHYIGFRILVNGNEVSTSRFNTWLRVKDCWYLTGVAPVSPGPVNVDVQARIFAIQGSNGDMRMADGPVSAALYERELVVHYKRR